MINSRAQYGSTNRASVHGSQCQRFGPGSLCPWKCCFKPSYTSIKCLNLLLFVQTEIFATLCSPNTAADLGITDCTLSQIRSCVRITHIQHVYVISMKIPKTFFLTFLKNLKNNNSKGKYVRRLIMSKMCGCHQEGNLLYNNTFFFWCNLYQMNMK